MTRETRIGLLVGLGFIIMFGLVLSELTGKDSDNAPPRTGALAAAERDGSFAWEPITNPPAAAVPALAATPAPTPTPIPAVPGPIAAVPENDPNVPPGSVRGTDEIVPVPVPAAPARPEETVAVKTPKQTYTVVAGDTPIKIAKKVYGAENAGKYKLILQANREALADETKLSIGQILVIPDLPAPVVPPSTPAIRSIRAEDLAQTLDEDAGARPGTPGTHGSEPVARTHEREPSPPIARPLEVKPALPVETPATPAKTYVVRRGDSLAKIARAMMNDDSPAAIQKIMVANRIRDARSLQVGLKLEIPRQG